MLFAIVYTQHIHTHTSARWYAFTCSLRAILLHITESCVCVDVIIWCLTYKVYFFLSFSAYRHSCIRQLLWNWICWFRIRKKKMEKMWTNERNSIQFDSPWQMILGDQEMKSILFMQISILFSAESHPQLNDKFNHLLWNWSWRASSIAWNCCRFIRLRSLSPAIYSGSISALRNPMHNIVLDNSFIFGFSSAAIINRHRHRVHKHIYILIHIQTRAHTQRRQHTVSSLQCTHNAYIHTRIARKKLLWIEDT